MPFEPAATDLGDLQLAIDTDGSVFIRIFEAKVGTTCTLLNVEQARALKNWLEKALTREKSAL